jgi:hypothetical protein
MMNALADAVLAVAVPGVVIIAVIVDLAAMAGWVWRRWCDDV